jgi:SSS family solute:Na+ symporter/sodium/proline symporter
VVVAGGCYFLGGFGRLYADKINIAANGYDSVVPTMLETLSPFLLGVIVILVLSASMSTLSSLVLASSSTLTLDFLKDNIVKKMDEKKQVLTMRALIVVFILISAVLAIIQYQRNVTFIAQLMGVSWGALAGAFLAPFLYGLYMKRTSLASVWVSFVFGAGIMTLNMLFRSAFPAWLQSPINCGAFAMLAGLVIVPIVSLVTPAPNKAAIDFAFAGYDRKVTVQAREALGDEKPQ